ncbi:MAG: RagB/SusD family nutrient uptake outer membrane protein, partial [Chitinophaga rupis]
MDTPLPKNELVSGLVFTDDKTATASVVGVYSDMNAFNYQFSNVLANFLTAMSADELYYYTTFANFDVFRNNALLPSSQYVSIMWSGPYSYIYHANACLEGLEGTTSLTPSVKSQLQGEMLFLRAFMYFYLVNLYGDVPLITSTDWQVNTNKPRDPQDVVYDQIIKDLQQAQSLLGDEYPSSGRIRPNKAVATAMLARVYLYRKQWSDAETQASQVIGNSRYQLLQDLNSVFLPNSDEAIWQLQPVNVAGGRSTWEGFTATPTATSTPL